MKDSLYCWVALFLFVFLYKDSHTLALQSLLYSQARNARTLQGYEQAIPLYQEILRQNPNDVTAATRIAADAHCAQRHDAFGRKGSQSDKLHCIRLLKSFRFDCNSIADLLFANNPAANQRAKQSSAPLVLQPLRAGTPAPPLPNCALGACIQLLLLGVCLPTKHCVALWGSDFVQLLQTLGLAFVHNDDDNDLLVPYVHVFPVTVGEETIYLATDLHPNVLSTTTIPSTKKDNESIGDNSTADDGAVMYIGPDSL